MKASTLIFTISLCCNVALAFVLVKQAFGTQGSFSPADRTDPSAAGEKASEAKRPRAIGLLQREQPSLWSTLDSADPVALAAKLRAAGFPSRAVRALMTELIAPERDAKFAELLRENEPTEYWKSRRMYARPRETGLKWDAYLREERDLTRKLFGSVYDMDDPEGVAYARRRLGNLPTEKLKQVCNLEDDYRNMSSELYSDPASFKKGELTVEAREKTALFEVEMQRELKETLTPEEYADYELHASGTAGALRSRMTMFRPTEQEYKTLFALQRSMDVQFTGKPPTEETRNAYLKAQEELDKLLEAELGADRYADYAEAREHGENPVNRLLVRLDLPLRTARTISQLRSDVSEKAKAVQQNDQLTSAQKSAQLSALATEARTALTKTLGEQGFEAYDDMKGEWIRALERNVAAPKP